LIDRIEMAVSYLGRVAHPISSCRTAIGWFDHAVAEANDDLNNGGIVMDRRGILRSFAAAGIGAGLAAARGPASAGSEDEELEEG
jgi:hypothetical protein